MDFGFKRWLRRMTREGILAGCYDALLAENGAPELSTEQAAAAFLDRVGGEPPPPPAVTDAPPPPQLPAAGADGTGQPAEQGKRGPGRPRKFQEPPA